MHSIAEVHFTVSCEHIDVDGVGCDAKETDAWQNESPSEFLKRQNDG